MLYAKTQAPAALRRLRPLLGALLLLALPAAHSAALSFEEAEQMLLDHSGLLKAARLNREAREAEVEATRSLNRPQVSATVAYSHLERRYEADLSAISGPLNQAIAAVGKAASVPLPALPSSLDYTYKNEGIRPSVDFNWLLYSGGRISATQALAGARKDEAGAEERHAGESLTTRLVSTYYGLELAEHALAVRRSVRDTLLEHLRQAERFEKTGLIARADRLHAQVAYDEAGRNLDKAEDDCALARVALKRLLGSQDEVEPASPLFVQSAPTEALEKWIGHGLAAHPALAALDAKRQQSRQMEAISTAALRPEVFAFGSYQFNRDALTVVEPDWIVGIAVRFTLHDRIDRASMIAASRSTGAGVEAWQQQMRDDIATLIEKRWRELEQARKRYPQLESSIALAEENVRLRDKGFREGLSTSLDLVDARLALARAEIERAQTARDYVVALAELLAASGQSERFPEFAARADIRIARPLLSGTH